MGKNHGINVYEEAWEQLTREKAFEGYMPEQVCISLMQTDNIICRPTVLPGEYVSRGQVIGEPAEVGEACVHASISGYVEEISNYQLAPGVFEPYVKIRKETDRIREWHPFAMDFGRDGIVQSMHRIGLSESRLKKSKVLVINGFANEPYITSGYRLIMESPGKIVIGAILGAMVTESENIYLCINEDAFDAVERMRRAVQKYEQNLGNKRPIWIVPMKRRYPIGNERILHKELLGKDKEQAVVVTVAEMAALYDGIYDGEPWTRVGITVSGEIRNPKNLWVPIGSNIQDIVEYCGGKPDGAVIIHGGPLGGQVVDGRRTWVTRETYGLLVLRLPDVPMSQCIHCGMCRDVCPQRLKPDQIEKKYLAGEEISKDERINECLRCGLCSYVCPSGRRLTEYIGQVKKGRTRSGNIPRERSERGDYIDLPLGKKEVKKMKSLEEKSQSAPHIHRRGTVYDVMRHSIYSLIPMLIAIWYLNSEKRLYFIAMVLVGMTSAWLAEYFWQTIFKRYISVYDGSALFTGLLLTLFFSFDTPLWKISLAAIIAIIVGKQLFGGIGYSPIHPVIVGKILFEPFSEPLIDFFWPLGVFALVWMVLYRMIPAVYPLTFLSILLIVKPELLLSASTYLVAAYFVWSYETMSPLKIGRWCFPIGIALLCVVFQWLGMGVTSLFLAVAFIDLFVPVFEFTSVKRV